MKKEKVVIDGQPVGRLKAGWLLFKESFRFMWADREMLWLPIIAGLANILLVGAIVALIVLASVSIPEAVFEKYPVEYVFIFLLYLAGAFTLSLSQAAVAHFVFVRAHGGDATLMEALKKAFSHWGGLLIWSAITSTVGLVLRAIFERSQLLGKLVAALIGAAWGVLTYFVVPAIVIDQKGPFSSIKKSGLVFKETWGEALVSNISFGVLFMLAHLAALFTAFGVIIFGVIVELMPIVLLGLALIILWVVVFSLVSSSISAVLRTLLYIYATEGTVPANFNRELLDKMLAKKKPEDSEMQGGMPDASPEQSSY